MATEDRPQGRRPVLLVVAWIATAAIAIAVSGWAVGLASRQVTDPLAPGALSEVTRAVPATPSPTPSATPSPSAAPSPAAAPSPTAAPPPRTAPSGSGGTSGGSTDATGGGTSGGAVAEPAPAVTTRTVSAVGGRAAFRFEGDRVTLEWATPASGFEVDVEQEGAQLRVRFRADSHESRIYASAAGGTPSTRVEERADDDDGSDSDSDDDDA